MDFKWENHLVWATNQKLSPRGVVDKRYAL